MKSAPNDRAWVVARKGYEKKPKFNQNIMFPCCSITVTPIFKMSPKLLLSLYISKFSLRSLPWTNQSYWRLRAPPSPFVKFQYQFFIRFRHTWGETFSGQGGKGEGKPRPGGGVPNTIQGDPFFRAEGLNIRPHFFLGDLKFVPPLKKVLHTIQGDPFFGWAA